MSLIRCSAIETKPSKQSLTPNSYNPRGKDGQLATFNGDFAYFACVSLHENNLVGSFQTRDFKKKRIEILESLMPGTIFRKDKRRVVDGDKKTVGCRIDDTKL